MSHPSDDSVADQLQRIHDAQTAEKPIIGGMSGTPIHLNECGREVNIADCANLMLRRVNESLEIIRHLRDKIRRMEVLLDKSNAGIDEREQIIEKKNADIESRIHDYEVHVSISESLRKEIDIRGKRIQELETGLDAALNLQKRWDMGYRMPPATTPLLVDWDSVNKAIEGYIDTGSLPGGHQVRGAIIAALKAALK
jgi:uncharacterized protein YeeX (DUF496 family)